MIETGARTFTVEELAEVAGLSVRTIRYYQSEGLLAAPARLGRQARYDSEHLARLRLIASLIERGLRLTAIAELLRRAPAGTTAADWLGLGETLARPWIDDRPVVLTAEQLAAQLSAGLTGGGADLGPDNADDALATLVRTGVIERRDDTHPVSYLVPSPGLLEAAIESSRLGLDPAAAAAMRDLLQRRIRRMAIDLVARFTEEVSMASIATLGPGGLAGLLEEIRPLTRRTVDLLFAHEMERAQRQLLAAAADAD